VRRPLNSVIASRDGIEAPSCQHATHGRVRADCADHAVEPCRLNYQRSPHENQAIPATGSKAVNVTVISRSMVRMRAGIVGRAALDGATVMGDAQGA
jgi:hypothetical protein